MIFANRPRLTLILLVCAFSSLGTPEKVLGTDASPLYAMAISSDGSIVATGGKSGVVTIRALKGEAAPQILEIGQEVYALAFATGGRVLAAGCGDHCVRLWQVRETKFVPGRTLRCNSKVLATAFSPDGNTLAAGVEGSGTLYLFDTTTGKLRCTLWEASNMISSLAFTPDGKSLASAGVNFKLWDVRPDVLRPIESDRMDLTIDELRENGKRAVKWESGSDPEYAAGLAFSRDATRLATVTGVGGPNSSGKTLSLWDMASKQRLRKITSQGMSTVGIAPDGERIITGSDDGTVRLWNATTGELQRHWKAHSQAVNAIAIVPDSGDLATVGEDGAFKLWDGTTGELKSSPDRN
jgi:WD40 repeat protein